MMTQKTMYLVAGAIIIVAVGYVAFTGLSSKGGLGNSTSQATTTETSGSASVQGKLNINVICEGALAYTSFTDGASADKFVAECKEGKHPEVIEHYKAQMNLGDGATI